MVSYLDYILMVVLMCFVVVYAEGEYMFIEERPLDYPKYDDDQYMQLLKNVKLPSRAPSEIPVYKEHCDSNDIDRFCCSVTKPVRPHELKSPHGEKLWVYQSKYFEQYISETRCKTESSKCFSDFAHKLINLEPKCKTDRGSISLLVHDREGSEASLRWITAPIDVSCSCHLTKIKNA